MDFSLTLAFSTGLIGGFGHCIGMCGPFVAAYTVHRARDIKEAFFPSLLTHLLFNLGRIFTYSFIGAIMGMSGSFVNSSTQIEGLQNIASFVAGLIMILLGFSIIGIAKGMLFFERYNSTLLRAIKFVLKDSSRMRYFPLGLLIGLLPCGLSYSIFIASAGSANLVHGMLISLFFGLGTSVSLMSFGYIFNMIGNKLRGYLSKMSGLLLIIMGIYFILKGRFLI